MEVNVPEINLLIHAAEVLKAREPWPQLPSMPKNLHKAQDLFESGPRKLFIAGTQLRLCLESTWHLLLQVLELRGVGAHGSLVSSDPACMFNHRHHRRACRTLDSYKTQALRLLLAQIHTRPTHYRARCFSPTMLHINHSCG